MQNYLKAGIEKIDDKFIYLNYMDQGLYFLYLESEKKILESKKQHVFYVGNFKNEYEDLQIIFLDLNMRNLFNLLIKVKTVGLKTTLYLLNNFIYEEFYAIVAKFDVEKLAALKGIGVYTARLIIDELQKKLFDNKLSIKKEKIVTSLIKLGFAQKNILSVMYKLNDNLSSEQMLQEIVDQLNGT